MQRSHHVDDALVDMHQLDIGQGALVGCAYSFENHALAVRLVHGQTGGLLQLANGLRCQCALAEERHNLEVDCIDLFAPVCNIHVILPSSA